MFSVGDEVHVAGLGKGNVREVRNGERYLVDVKGRAVVVSGDQLTAHASAKKKVRAAPVRASSEPPRPHPADLDLHGHTVAEALEAVSAFVNAALLAGSSEVRIIHGRGGGKIKAALHAELKRIPSIRGFRVDPSNAGVTIVAL